MKTRDIKYIRDKLITLFSINIFQPVEKEVLLKQLDSIHSKRLDRILKELLSEKRVVVEKNHFRLSYKGMESMLPDKGRVFRDIQRMEYLSQLSKKGGGQ